MTPRSPVRKRLRITFHPGQKFSRLTILDYVPGTVRCYCECGTVKWYLSRNVFKEKSRSCGCLQREAASKKTHGLIHTPEYNSWSLMKDRCLNQKSPKYHNYGGRGISVCDRWRTSFENFYADMGPKPSPKHSIDRINNNGNYESGNCRWATQLEQCSNQRKNRLITFRERTLTISQWSRETGVSGNTIARRIAKGLTVEMALLCPAYKAEEDDTRDRALPEHLDEAIKSGGAK